jgi:hypothetical protein
MLNYGRVVKSIANQTYGIMTHAREKRKSDMNHAIDYYAHNHKLPLLTIVISATHQANITH